jgi:hypothetical protein
MSYPLFVMTPLAILDRVPLFFRLIFFSQAAPAGLCLLGIGSI